MIATLLATAVIASPLSLGLRVEGNGYLRFALDGRIVYAKEARFSVAEGKLRHIAGANPMPMIEVPANASGLDAEPNGVLYAVIGSERKEIGRLSLALFEAQTTLTPQGEFLIAKARPRLGTPGAEGVGTIQILGLATKPISDAKASKANGAPPVGMIAQIKVPAEVTLTGDRVVLADLGEIEANAEWGPKLEAIDFGAAPAVNFPLRLTRARVYSRIKFLGLDEKAFRLEMPEVVTVSARSQRVEPTALIDAARKLAQDKLGPNVKLDQIGEVSGYTAPLGALELRANDIEVRRDNVVVTLGIFVDGKQANTKSVAFTGTGLAAAVKANDAVKVIMRTNGIAVEAIGRVKKEARIGESVEVTIEVGKEKTTHIGVVKGPGLVEVTL